MSTTTEIPLGDVLVAVSGMTASQVDIMFDALKSRRQVLRSIEASVALDAIKPGDAVRLKGLSPKYLNGLSGTVTAVVAGKFKVEFDNSVPEYSRGRFGDSVTVPASAVERA